MASRRAPNICMVNPAGDESFRNLVIAISEISKFISLSRTLANSDVQCRLWHFEALKHCAIDLQPTHASAALRMLAGWVRLHAVHNLGLIPLKDGVYTNEGCRVIYCPV